MARIESRIASASKRRTGVVVQKPVLGVDPGGILGRSARLLEGLSEDQPPDQPLQGPAVGDELPSQMVQEQAVGGPLAEVAEVVDGAHQTSGRTGSSRRG